MAFYALYRDPENLIDCHWCGVGVDHQPNCPATLTDDRESFKAILSYERGFQDFFALLRRGESTEIELCDPRTEDPYYMLGFTKAQCMRRKKLRQDRKLRFA